MRAGLVIGSGILLYWCSPFSFSPSSSSSSSVCSAEGCLALSTRLCSSVPPTQHNQTQNNSAKGRWLLTFETLLILSKTYIFLYNTLSTFCTCLHQNHNGPFWLVGICNHSHGSWSSWENLTSNKTMHLCPFRTCLELHRFPGVELHVQLRTFTHTRICHSIKMSHGCLIWIGIWGISRLAKFLQSGRTHCPAAGPLPIGKCRFH